jgi:hypothetical protein
MTRIEREDDRSFISPSCGAGCDDGAAADPWDIPFPMH